MRPKRAIPHPHSLLLRSQVVLFGMLFVAGQLGGFVHDAFVQHVYCPEHGKLVHLAGSGHGDDLLTAAPQGQPLATDHHHDQRDGSEVDAHSQAYDSNRGDDGRGHDLCHLSITSRERMCRPASANAHLNIAAVCVLSASAPIVRISVLARYVIAPKNSPPLA